MFRGGLIILASWLVAAAAWAAPGVMLKDEALRASASATAPTLGKLAKGEAVEILARQGGWSQVRGRGKTGWVRLLSVRGGAAAQTDVAGELQGVLSLGATRRDPNKVVAVAGVRGLGEEELKQAHFDERALRQMEGFAASGEEAARFAAAAGLARRELAYLPAPQTGAAGESSWGTGQ